jgi:uncharacterized tellurite resistance protein B-like protein
MKLRAADFAAMTDAQRLAVLEALIVGMIADGKVVPAEVSRFDDIVMTLPWGVEESVLKAMVKGAHARAMAVKTPAEVNDFVAGLAARLPSQELREKVVYTMATIICADGEVAQLEKNVIGLFALAFGITSDRLAAIRTALTGQTGPVPPRTHN